MNQEPDVYEDHPSDNANGFGYDSEDETFEDEYEDDEHEFDDDELESEDEEPEE